MKKKNVSQKQFDEYYDGIINKSDNKTEEISIIRSEADKKYRDIINKLLAADRIEEYVMAIVISCLQFILLYLINYLQKFDTDLKRKTELTDQKIINTQFQKLLTLDIKTEKEKFISYINDNHYKSEKVNWTQVFDFVEKEDKNVLNDPNILKNSNLRYHNYIRQLIINISIKLLLLLLLLIYSVIRQKMLDKYKYENVTHS